MLRSIYFEDFEGTWGFFTVCVFYVKLACYHRARPELWLGLRLGHVVDVLFLSGAFSL